MSQWFAFRVPSQRELTAQKFLAEKRGLEVFVPFEIIERRVRAKGGGRKLINVPRAKMPGYVFINTEDPHALVRRFGILLEVIGSDGIARPIFVGDIIRHMMESGRKVLKESPPLKLQIGQTIRITNGAGQGLTGKITASKGERASIKLAKPLLGRDVIEVKTGSLEAA